MSQREIETCKYKTTNQGVPVESELISLTAGADGPVLLQDTLFIQDLSHGLRERIPERVVYARGTGALGHFELYKSMEQYTKAKLFSDMSSTTDIFVRFSSFIGSLGSSETNRDVRGFAIKFYTSEGNYDLVCNNMPIFFIRDAMKFPDLVHAFKPSPDTNLNDPNRFWDFVVNSPESTNIITWLFSDKGTIKSYIHMPGYGVNTYVWVNKNGERTYVKYHIKPLAGEETITNEESKLLSGFNDTAPSMELYTTLSQKKPIEYELYVQLMEPDTENKLNFDPLDATKLWPLNNFPLIKVGKLTLTDAPIDYFAQVEQAAFSPANFIPGIETSNCKLLQGRLFSYNDSQLYRLGANYEQLPVNRPKVMVCNGSRAARMDYMYKIGLEDYDTTLMTNKKFKIKPVEGKVIEQKVSGYIGRFKEEKGDDFTQAGEQYRSYSSLEKNNLIANIIDNIKTVDKKIQLMAIDNFTKADPDFGERVRTQLFSRTKYQTSSQGSPIFNDSISLTASKDGPVLLNDLHLIEKLAHFDRERIPERIVHTKGTGAHGYFTLYNSMEKYTKAKLFNNVKNTTEVFVRFSTTIGLRGSEDTIRGPRGFAVRFYTEEGNYDLVGADAPVFFINDAINIIELFHAFSPSPLTNLYDANLLWNFFATHPESTNAVTYACSDEGTKKSYIHMNGFGINTYVWVNKNGEKLYIKYHFKTLSGLEDITQKEARILAGTDRQVATKELYEALKSKKKVEYELYVQIMDPAIEDTLSFNPIDATKIWPEKDFPLIKVGKLTLTNPPKDFFDEVEQAAFSPSNFIPGIEPSNCRLLQGRLFAYKDAQRYRVGTNFEQLPINKPKNAVYNNERFGPMQHNIYSGNVDYSPSILSKDALEIKPTKDTIIPEEVSGYISRVPINKDDNFTQAGEHYRSLTQIQKDHLVSNITDQLQYVDKKIQLVAIENFTKADLEFGASVQKSLNKLQK